MSGEALLNEEGSGLPIATENAGVSGSEPVGTVYLVGNGELSCDLLAYYLRSQGELNCVSVQSWSQVHDQSSKGAGVLLLDAARRDWGWLGTRLTALEPSGGLPYPLALLNLDRELGREKLAMAMGVRGFFYANNSPRVILKGIDTLLNGEMWVSRRLMSEYLMDGAVNGQGTTRRGGADRLLSQREKEIIALMARGRTNQNIAEQLFISLHTVKTHVYNIFRKLEVNNRIQAVNWANQNLADPNAGNIT